MSGITRRQAMVNSSGYGYGMRENMQSGNMQETKFKIHGEREERLGA